MSSSIATRVANVQSPVIPIVGKWVRENPGTISLGQGVVRYPPPPEVAQAVADAALKIEAVAGPLDRYGDVCGNAPLIELLTSKLRNENGIELGEEAAVVCTAGANMGFLNAILALGDVDDEIILLSPYYFNHQMAIEIAGCRPVAVPTTSEYQIDVERIRESITPRTRAIVTISPNNPTGAVYAEADLREVNRICGERGLYHISDEAYEYFVYGDQVHYSPASDPTATNHTISLFSLSKAYGMAGWRVGYMVVPNALLMSIKKIQDTNLICPPMINQVAAAAAIEVGPDGCRQHLEELDSVRTMVLEELSCLERCRIPTPDGAFYAFLQLESSCDDMQLVKSLVHEFGVAVLPGSAFEPARDDKRITLRASYGALDPQSVRTGVSRLRKGLVKLL